MEPSLATAFGHEVESTRAAWCAGARVRGCVGRDRLPSVSLA